MTRWGREIVLTITGVVVALCAVCAAGITFWWAIRTANPAIIPRGGALLIFAGVVLAGVPYLQPSSIRRETFARLTTAPEMFMIPDMVSQEISKKREEEHPHAFLAVVIERYVAFSLVAVGTLIAGFGDLLLGASF